MKNYLRTPMAGVQPRSALPFMLGLAISSAATAAPDRLQLINGTGPSVSPGTALNDGILLGDTLVFTGTNLSNSASSELHGATLNAGAFTIPGLASSGASGPVDNVTHLTRINDVLYMTDEAFAYRLGLGDVTATLLDNTVGGVSESVVQNNRLFVSGVRMGQSGEDILSYDASLDNVSTATTDGSVRSVCTSRPEMAVVGSQSVVFVRNVSGDSTLARTVNGAAATPVDSTGSPPFETPCDLYAFNNRVYFDAFESGTSSNQLWSTDGTAAGTARLRGFNIESNGTFTPKFREFGGRLLFAARETNAGGYGLWATDGTIPGTVLISDMAAAIGAISPDVGTEYQGHLFFPVGSDIWRTDGTTEGTVQLMDADNAPLMADSVSFSEFDEQFHLVAGGSVYRMSGPTAVPELISGIDETVIAINGALGNQLLVAANENLFTMAREPVLSIAENTTVDEDVGTQQVSVQISLSEVVPYEVMATVMLQPGTAMPGSDYIDFQGGQQMVVIPAMQMQTTVDVTLQNNTDAEETETLQVVVSNIDGARLADRAASSTSGTVTITDSDAPVQAGSIQVQSASVAEGAGSVDVLVVTGGNSAVDINFDFAFINGTATANSDFRAEAGSGTIAAGSSSTTITVPIIDDMVDEPNEMFTVSVTPTSGLTNGIGMAVNGTVSIIDDDDAAPVASSSSSGGGGGGCSVLTAGSSRDPLLPGLGLLALGILVMRRRASAS